MTSKEQELKALEKIKDIVEGLGEDSYIAVAFEGCFEIAAKNIEDDFACSMKQRVAGMEKTVSKLEAENKKLVRELNDACRNNDLLRERIEQLNNRFLTNQEIEKLEDIVDEKIAECETAVKDSAQNIVKYADNPNSQEFREEVARNRRMAHGAKHYSSLKKKLSELK